MANANTIHFRREFLLAKIALEGGRYITPEANAQPEAALRIASIRCGDIVGIGATEAEAQVDFLRQAFADVPPRKGGAA